MKKLILKIVLLIFTAALFYTPAIAQNSIPNLSNANVDQLSDAQIQQIIQKGQANGLSNDQIVQNAENNGMSAAQGGRLLARIKQLQGTAGTAAQNSAPVQQATRGLNYKPDDALEQGKLGQSHSPIFGADLFRNSNTTFEPNINLATPVNYILGPGDEVDVSVYGKSIVNWKLVVSPEGNINLPSGGVINVAGKTIETATSIIKSRLIAKNYDIGHGTDVKITLGDIRSIHVIMVGEVVKPGTYTVPSLATAFNALYAAGGPNDNGSFRTIEIIRNNRVVRHLDIYNFLVDGDQKDNIGLQDQDIIRIPAYRTRVEINGEIKNPAVFEMLKGESLNDLIKFAGGFTSSAYRALITVSQISGQQRRITDVAERDFNNYVPLPGDSYKVGKILERYENRVTISGAVFRPGEFELSNNLMLSQLIAEAGGIKEDAFTNLATITRLNADNTTQILSFNLNEVLNKNNDLKLQREDQVSIRSIFDLRDRYNVAISGDVRSPGDYAYADSMSVENLILLAGGFSNGASAMHIEVARRVYDGDPSEKNTTTAKVFNVDVDPKLSRSANSFRLKPYDIVLVYKVPGYNVQGIVRIEGEAIYPGPYSIQNKTEKISDILARAGGLTSAADASGSTLRRSYVAFLGIDKSKADTASLIQQHVQRLSVLKENFKDTTNTIQEIRNDYIGINLVQIMQKPGSVTDLIVKDGDVIRIPQQQQIVQINGEVHMPSGVVYEKGKSFSDYISNAGGYSDDAKKRGAYVIYPNGTVQGTHKFLFFNSYPEIKPGTEIFIPKKPIRHGFNVAGFVGIITAVGSTALLAIIGLRR